MQLYIFNPENDMALANGGSRYTPSKNAADFARDCALLPAWYAEPGATVMAEIGETERRLLVAFGIDCRPFSRDTASEITAVTPWGWSEALRYNLLRDSITPEALPSSAAIEKIRALSHRRTSLIINEMLRAKGIDTPPGIVEVDSVSALADLLSDNRPRFLKAPWSSSGRGIMDTRSIARAELLRRIEGVIRHQGSVIAEPYLNRIADFAMLFEIRNGSASYAGLSVFENHGTSAYAANLVATDEILREIIEQTVGKDALFPLQTALCEILTDVIGTAYSGFCGIDMMAYRDDDGVIRVASCIELNLRMTMGVVALKLRKLLADNVLARMSVESPRELTPPQISNTKLESGEVNLTPSGKKFAIILQINSRNSR